MCRLFGLSAGRHRTRATVWLLDVPDSLRRQSRANPDGTGLGTFAVDGTPVVERQPLAAHEDAAFAREARRRESTTFVAHVRRATTGGISKENTQPFTLDGRIFAHNGVVEGLPDLERHLGGEMRRVRGETDSERVFALVTAEIARAEGDVGAGITSATAWIAEHLPVFALNLLLSTPTGLWALRYPDTHELWLLDRRETHAPLHHRSVVGTEVHSTDLAQLPSVVVASERMDGDSGWRLLPPGALVHVTESLGIEEHLVLDHPPRHRLTLGDLDPAVAASQRLSRSDAMDADGGATTRHPAPRAGGAYSPVATRRGSTSRPTSTGP